MEYLSKQDIIRAYKLADEIVESYDYISFMDAYNEVKDWTSLDVFTAAYEEAEEIWENDEEGF